MQARAEKQDTVSKKDLAPVDRQVRFCFPARTVPAPGLIVVSHCQAHLSPAGQEASQNPSGFSLQWLRGPGRAVPPVRGVLTSGDADRRGPTRHPVQLEGACRRRELGPPDTIPTQGQCLARYPLISHGQTGVGRRAGDGVQLGLAFQDFRRPLRAIPTLDETLF